MKPNRLNNGERTDGNKCILSLIALDVAFWKFMVEIESRNHLKKFTGIIWMNSQKEKTELHLRTEKL